MAQLTAKQHKLDMLRNIINQDSDNGSRLRNTGNDEADMVLVTRWQVEQLVS